MIKNDLIDEIRDNDTKAPMVFYGYPGSGRACAIASIIENLNVIKRSTVEIICADDWTLGKNEQLRTFSNILGCSFRKMQLPNISIDIHRKTFIYLPYDLTSCNQLFDLNTYRKFLVLDCSRRFSINVDLINQVGISRAACNRAGTDVPCLHDRVARPKTWRSHIANGDAVGGSRVRRPQEGQTRNRN